MVRARRVCVYLAKVESIGETDSLKEAEWPIAPRNGQRENVHCIYVLAKKHFGLELCCSIVGARACWEFCAAREGGRAQ